MTREEFLALIKEAQPTVEYTGAISYKSAFQRREDAPFWEVAFGTQIVPYVSNFIDESKFKHMTEQEAREIIQTTLNRLVTLREEIHAFIKERLAQ